MREGEQWLNTIGKPWKADLQAVATGEGGRWWGACEVRRRFGPDKRHGDWVPTHARRCSRLLPTSRSDDVHDRSTIVAARAPRCLYSPLRHETLDRGCELGSTKGYACKSNTLWCEIMI